MTETDSTTADATAAESTAADATSGQRRALIIAHEADGPGGRVAVELERRGIRCDTHVVVADNDRPADAAPFPDWADYDVVVPMGSIRSLTRRDEIRPWVDTEIELLRAARERNQPVLGICFGGQLMADAFGGSVEAAPRNEIGWLEIEPIDGQENPVGPGPWLEWHHDRFAPPPDAQVLARTEVGPQLFTLDRMVGTQFHPEVDVAHVEHWLSGADPAYLEAHGVDADAILDATRRNEATNIEGCRRLVDWFLDEVAFPDGL